MIFKPSISAEILTGLLRRRCRLSNSPTPAEQLERIQRGPRNFAKRWGRAICATRRIACGAWMSGRTGRAALQPGT